MLWCYIFLQLHFTSRSPSAFTVGLETPKLRAELVPVPGDQTSLKDQKVKQTLEERRHFCETLGFCATSRSWRFLIKSVQFSSVAQSCLTLWDPMGCSTPGFPVLHYLPELAQTHVHLLSDDIQPAHPLSSPLLLLLIIPSNRVFSNESTLNIRWPKYWSFSISPSREYSGLISFRIDWFDFLAIQGTLRVFSNTTVQKHQFFETQPSLWSNSHICTWLLGKTQLWLYRLCRQRDISAL